MIADFIGYPSAVKQLAGTLDVIPREIPASPDAKIATAAALPE